MAGLLRRGAAWWALLIGFGLAGAAAAQTPPAFRNLDSNGVDLTHGDHFTTFTEASIGSGDAALALVRVRGGASSASQWDHITFQRTVSGASATVVIGRGATSQKYSGTIGSLSPGTADGSTLVLSGDYIHTAADGTVTVFGDPSGPYSGGDSNFCVDADPVQASCALVPLSIASPDGRTVTLSWTLHSIATGINFPQDHYHYYRLASVSNSFGYSIQFAYSNNSPTPNQPPPNAWFTRTGATLHNAAAGSGALASVSYSEISSTVVDVTDPMNRTWRITGSGRITAIRRPGESADSWSVTYNGSAVSSATNEGVTTTYARSVSGNTATTTVTNALSQQTVVVSDLAKGRPTSVTDALSRQTSYQYDSYGRLTRVTAPEGNYAEHTYDPRGNVTQTQLVPKSGSGQSTITVSASFPSTCTDPVTCNRPTSTTDARGHVTDYTWDSTHGGLLTVTAPAPASGAVRPQTRYSWTLANGEYRLTGISACQTGSSCSGAADEAKTTIAWNADGTVASVTRSNGTGTLSATETMSYDTIGNLVGVDGPLAGSADTLRYRYNAARELVGTISPDPDGGGSLKHRAMRRTIATNLTLTKVETGTVDGTSDTDWANFAALEAVEISYDAGHRPSTQKLVSGGTAYALTQYGYDALGRVDCAAQRMNVSVYGSLPSSACSMSTQGTHGPDRIAKATWDAAGQQTKLTTGYGSSVEADEWTKTFTNNGLVATITDGENNKTTWEYDGHDRLKKTRFPLTTQGAGTSSTTDYEELSYDAAGNVTSRRLRDGNSFGLSYDNLGRLTAKDLPGSEPDVSYSYDALSRMTGASQSGNALTFGYDALSRNTSQAGPLGTTGFQHDAAGRRTRITHADGFYVDYDHLVTGEVIKLRENGATSGVGVLATYAYDDRGRRTSLTRGNGTSKSYAYDAVSRLNQMVEDLTGTSGDLTLGFSHNPASQIAQATRSNDSYAWSDHYNVNVAYTANGLNQYTAVGSVTPTYDAKGNLTSAGSATYGYSSENLLTSASGGITLKYDPMLRLYETAGGSAGTTRFAYDGVELIAEYNNSNAMLRRYVHGPGIDEPIVWYEGSGTSDRRWLHADERGSIVAASNSSGATISTNAYDEYGIPKSTNVGRFQYTGQTWLPELGMYYYKARMYAPKLGRFLQTDPIGYGDGMNLYAYVGNDPVNFRDPYGLCMRIIWARIRHTPEGEIIKVLAVWMESYGCDAGSPETTQPGAFGGVGGPEEDPPCDPPGTAYPTPQAAGAAGVRYARMKQREAEDKNERGNAILSLPNGRFTFAAPNVGTPDQVAVSFFEGRTVGWYHIHTIPGSGDTLSSQTTYVGSRVRTNSDLSVIDILQQKTGLRSIVSVLGKETGGVASWRGKGTGKGKDEGTDQCTK